nr:MAG TPA: hypothetical protein [Caudoviricetes sp.]
MATFLIAVTIRLLSNIYNKISLTEDNLNEN